MTRSRFAVLCRTFFSQFFTSESVTSDEQLRRTIIWVLAFLLTPGLLLLIQIFPQYQDVVIRARRFHSFALVDDTLEWVALLFVTYSMVTVGAIAVFVWDALTFERRDAMVLGPLPLRGATVFGAKLAALGLLLIGASTTVNLLNAVVFALATSDQLGGAVLLRHFVAHLTATVLAATFVFSVIVTIRGTVTLLFGPRVAAALGSLLQFLFVIALLSFVILCPAVWRIPHPRLNNPTTTGWLPPSWFLGLFEQLRGSSRAYFVPLAARALIATPIAVAAAILVSVAGFHRQMQRALAPPANAGPLGAARVSRTLAQWIAGRPGVASATVDFILLTIARNRPYQTPIAMNAAIGVAIVIGGLSYRARDFASLGHPRTVVLWIPFVLAYWITIGVRASFFVPSELPAAWSFRASAPEQARAYWSAARAAMIAIVVPPTLLVAGLLVPLLGWRVAAWNALVACVVAIVIVEAAALSIGFIPFTRAYRPGHAKLRSRWPLYLFGMYPFAVWPARVELSIVGHPAALLGMVGWLAAAVVVLEMVGRRRAWSVEAADEPDHGSSVTVLDIGDVTWRARLSREPTPLG